MRPNTKKRIRGLVWAVGVFLAVPVIKWMARRKLNGILVPKTREEWVARYLRLELGQEDHHPDSIQAADLVYLGQFTCNGLATDYWSFPNVGEPMWAIVMMDESGETVSMTNVPPQST